MSNKISILEIRKLNFIEEPNKYNLLKLVEKIDNHKDIFDNIFFAKATKNALCKNNIYGLLHIASLYMELNRNVEAEYLLSRAHKIDEKNNEITYWYFDILCRRKQLCMLSSIEKKIKEANNELMYIKSMIKYFILTNKEKELYELVKSLFEKYKTDREFISLVLTAAIQNNNYYLTHLVSKTQFQKELFGSLSKQGQIRIKNHFYAMIINLLNEKNYVIKNC
jgi:hypothetical protein